MTTKKLFYDHSYMTEFAANVISVNEVNGNYEVILDKSCFYPESGGQPCDLGQLGEAQVTYVYEKNQVLYHLCSHNPGTGAVHCKIDGTRRFEHMQQHTGQHILSASFEKLLNGGSSSFTIGKESSTIEIDIPFFDWETARQVEQYANEIIYKNLPVSSYFVNQEQLSKLPLRKQPKVSTDIRIVEIQDTDFSPCGGTHVSYTGEVGIIKIKRWEKLKESFKFEFLCGSRALRDYGIKNELINRLGSIFSVRDFEIEAAVSKSIEDYKALQREYGQLRGELLQYKIKELLAAAQEFDGFRLIAYSCNGLEINELRQIAQEITKQPSYVVLLTSVIQSLQVVFARSNDLAADMNLLLKEALPIIEGKGGGNAKAAQGGGSRLQAVEEFLEAASSSIINKLLNK